MRAILFVLVFLTAISNALFANIPTKKSILSSFFHLGVGPTVTLIEPQISGSVQTRIDFGVSSSKNFSFRIGPEIAYFFLGKDFKSIFLGPSFGVFYDRVLSNNHIFSTSMRLPIHAIIGNWYGGSVSINPGVGYYFSNNIGIYGELGAQVFFAGRPDAAMAIILAVGSIGVAYRF